MLTYKPPIINDYNPSPKKLVKRKKALDLIAKQLETSSRIDPNGKIQLVISWDWWMLQAMKDHKNDNVIFFWLNAWTVWFLTNDMLSQHFPETLDDLTIIDIPIIETLIIKKNWERFKSYFINDILLNKSAAHYHCFTLTSQTKGDLIEIIWSSLLINTPLWSTGQALNADVPILDINSTLRWISWSYLKWFKRWYLQPEEITITDTRWRDSRHVYHDGKNDGNIIYDVESVTLYKPTQYLKLWFKNDENYNDRRVLLAQESLWNVLIGKYWGMVN